MNITSKQIAEKMKDQFGFSSFREGQLEIIQDVLNGENVLGILPTGTGKSMCYQLPSLFFRGITVVVSPLISLMVDQVKQMKARGFKRVTAINSIVDNKQKSIILQNLHQYKLIYCSPEILQNDLVMSRLKSVNISLFVIDEAHCISQWGHEFRTDYLKLKDVLDELNNPPILALSATATPEVQQDIMEHLNCPNMKRRVYQMDRSNIAFVVEQVSSWYEKVERIVEILSEKPVPTMIYFSSRMWCEKVSLLIAEKLTNLRVSYYHGGMESEDRLLIQQQFMNNHLDVICSTSAFGMGVDKQDVRLVIHFHLPTQLESYIQEVGRAGRDGEQSIGLILFSSGDEQVPLSLLEQELPTDSQVQNVFQYLYKSNSTNLSELKEQLIFHNELSDSQWNFLVQQLEKYDLVQNDLLQIDRHKWIEGYERMIAYKNNRFKYKLDKFNQLLQWTNTLECRRKTLYASFQTGFKQPEELCCDYCDSIMEKWDPPVLYREVSKYDWQEKLKDIFYQEGI